MPDQVQILENLGITAPAAEKETKNKTKTLQIEETRFVIMKKSWQLQHIYSLDRNLESLYRSVFSNFGYPTVLGLQVSEYWAGMRLQRVSDFRRIFLTTEILKRLCV